MVFQANLKYEALDSAVFTWFCNARGHNIPVDGTMLKEKALQLAKMFDPQTKFTASVGWLDKFVKRNDIVFRTLSGEGASTDGQVVTNWKENLLALCAGYEPKDIYNIDETGLVFKQGPRRSYVERNDTGHGTKADKKRLTVCLFANAIGEKENPIVIGHAKKPRCFAKTDVNKTFNIVWKSNKKAWMTSVIFEEILKTFNRKMRIQKRNVLLFLDNVSSHPNIILSNVKLMFLPANTTTDCQPLDQGIIHSFKVHYRKVLMRSIVSSIDERLRSNIMNTEEDFSRKITVLDSLGWIREAWDAVRIETIQNCFATCGFPVETVIEVQDSLEIPGVPIPSDALDFINFDNNERKHSIFRPLLWSLIISTDIAVVIESCAHQ